jgi:glycosyltransferase involved in cell wall biosynthesis
MKVLVITSSFPRYKNSHEVRYILELTQWLSRIGHSLVVLAPHYPGGKIRESWDLVQVQRFVYFFPIRFERLAYGPGLLFNIKNDFFAYIGILPFLVFEFLSSLNILFSEPVKLIHTHWLIPQGFFGAFFHRLWRIPHVATVHGSDLNILTHHKILTPLARFIFRNSDMITVNSDYMKRRLESIAPDCSAKIRVIPMGIDPEKFKATEFIDIKKKYQTEHLVLSVGRLIDWKGTIHLINAMPAVLRQFPDTVLLIIGAGPEKETLVNRTHEISLENRIHFLGVVDNEDLPSYYHAADVFVLPSINKSGKTEALGVVLLEAMASGCPVIGSNVGGIPDIIVDGETGFLVPEQRSDVLAERIVQMLSDDNVRERFRQNGLMRVREKFSWEKISEGFGGVYSQVLTD